MRFARRFLLLTGVLALALLAAAAAGAEAQGERRVALVIGNSAYETAPRLPNPVNDAAAMAERLERLGFEVMEALNLDKRGMERTLAGFARRLEGADVGLFFYAGHGLQVENQNYLVPVDAELEHEADLPFQAIAFDIVLDQLERSVPTSLVFLDACRDNPLARSLARSMGATRSAAVGRGLAEVESDVGTLIAFATQPDNVALDGDGEHSPFTQALLEHIDEPGLEVRQVLTRVRRNVLETTDGRQVPWDYSSLTRDFYFAPEETPVKTAEPETPARDSRQEIEVVFWESIRDSANPADYEAYLDRFGHDGLFAAIARNRLDALEGNEQATAAVDAAETAEPERAGPEQARDSRPEPAPDPPQPRPEPRPSALREEEPDPASEQQQVASLDSGAASAESTGDASAAAALLARGPIHIVADVRDGHLNRKCAGTADVDAWQPAAGAEVPIRFADALGRPRDEAAASLDAFGARGGAAALAAGERVAAVGYLEVPEAPQVFRQAGAGPARLCYERTARWRAWRFLAEAGAEAEEYGTASRGGLFGGFVGGLDLAYVRLALEGRDDYAGCIAFEGVNERKQWLGGYFCEKDSAALDLDRFLDNITVADILE